MCTSIYQKYSLYASSTSINKYYQKNSLFLLKTVCFVMPLAHVPTYMAIYFIQIKRNGRELFY